MAFAAASAATAALTANVAFITATTATTTTAATTATTTAFASLASFTTLGTLCIAGGSGSRSSAFRPWGGGCLLLRLLMMTRLLLRTRCRFMAATLAALRGLLTRLAILTLLMTVATCFLRRLVAATLFVPSTGAISIT